MDKNNKLARKYFKADYNQITSAQQKILEHFQQRSHISNPYSENKEAPLSFGQRLADKVAEFGGSWKFIIIFTSLLIVWIVLNSYILVTCNKAFDPYPYILLNLFLSLIAALQAPVIMMSQNRFAEKDRIAAKNDYEVNLKAELEILELHEKIDFIIHKQMNEVLDFQKQQEQRWHESKKT